MRVTCQHCDQGLTIADDKAPARPFQLTCPSCKKRFVVAADRVAADRVAADRVAADRDPADRVAADRVTADRVTTDAPAPSPAGELPKLRPAEQELLSGVVPEAYVVDLGESPLGGLTAELERLGMEEVRQLETLEEAVEALSDAGAGVLVIRVDKASTPPYEPLEPLERLSFAERRHTFVVLVADNVKSLDGQVAFYLQVNCLINAQDAGRFAALVRRALLHHLRLYRYWTIETTA